MGMDRVAGLLLLAVPLSAQTTRSVTILHLNDTHANFVAGAPRLLRRSRGAYLTWGAGAKVEALDHEFPDLAEE